VKRLLLQMLEEDAGEVSLARVILLISFVVCILLPLLVWGGISIAKQAPQEFPTSISSFCLTAFGSAATLKFVQKFAEPK
jgi:hypothetical protein